MSISALPVLDGVTRANVDALLNGDALAIWLKGFIRPDHCDHVYEHVRAAPLKPLLVHYTREDGSADYHAYANVLRVNVDEQLDQYFELLTATKDAARRTPAHASLPGVGASGGSKPDAQRAAIELIMEEYLSCIGASNEANNRLCAPYRRPCDVLFDHLDEVCGIRIAEFNGREMKFGTFLLNRRSDNFDDPTTVPIHVDSVPSVLFPSIHAQLGAMVYCRVPSIGGELRVYDHPIIPRDAPIPPEIDHSYAYRSLKPSAGDALLINSRRPHAVIPGKDDDRLANIMFIGSNGEYPLRIWT